MTILDRLKEKCIQELMDYGWWQLRYYCFGGFVNGDGI